MRAFGISLTAAACLLWAQTAAARDCCGAPDCCAQCGSGDACQPKVCRVVCGMKEIKKHYWSVECEEFCAPLPRCGGRGCDSCSEGGCAASEGCDEGCSESGSCPTPPKCGRVRCRKILVKKEYKIKVPVYKCVVDYLCPTCCGPSGCGEEGTPEPTPENSGQTTKSAPSPPVASDSAYLKGLLN